MIYAPPNERMRSAEAAKYIGVNRSTLAKWRAARTGPPYHRCGARIIQYYRAEIDAWFEACDRRDCASATTIHRQ